MGEGGRLDQLSYSSTTTIVGDDPKAHGTIQSQLYLSQLRLKVNFRISWRCGIHDTTCVRLYVQTSMHVRGTIWEVGYTDEAHSLSLESV